MKTQKLQHIVFLVADPDIWKKEMCKPLEQLHFIWKNNKCSHDICTWVYIDITTKELCMGAPGIALHKLYIDHAISFDDFHLVYNEYLAIGRIADSTRDKLLAKYKAWKFMATNKEEDDRKLAAEAEYQRQLKLPKTIITYEEYRERVRNKLPGNERQFIMKECEDIIQDEYDYQIERLKNNKITQKQFDEYFLDDFVGRLLFWY